VEKNDSQRKDSSSPRANFFRSTWRLSGPDFSDIRGISGFVRRDSKTEKKTRLGVGRLDPLLSGPVRLRAAELRFPLTLGAYFHAFLNHGNWAIRRNHHHDNVVMLGGESQRRIIARAPEAIFTGNRSARPAGRQTHADTRRRRSAWHRRLWPGTLTIPDFEEVGDPEAFRVSGRKSAPAVH
jgi:hypothetical protein